MLIAKQIAELFGSPKDSDCTIIFYKEEQVDVDEHRNAKRQKLDKGTGDGGRASGSRCDSVLLDALPGHQLVLRLASDRFRAKIERWDSERPAGAAAAAPAAAAADCLELHVVLGDASEVPAARAAIAFAYTNQVRAMEFLAVMEVRRQAAYLQINGCVAACDQRVAEGLEADTAAAVRFYKDAALWPHPPEEPAFGEVVTAAAQRALAAHFRDAVAVLNAPALRAQLLELPAAGVEALLGSEEFGTDSEDTVLLLLATWVRGNDNLAALARACRLVRLVQLSPAYMSLVLPALALDHEITQLLHSYSVGRLGPPPAATGEEAGPAGATAAAAAGTAAVGGSSSVGWFPISGMEAVRINALATALSLVAERAATAKRLAVLYDRTLPWHSTAPRRHCIPASGMAFEWSISKKELERALAAAAATGTSLVTCAVEGVEGGGVLAGGVAWRPQVEILSGASAAGLFLRCELPDALRAEGSRLASCVGVVREVQVPAAAGGAGADAGVGGAGTGAEAGASAGGDAGAGVVPGTAHDRLRLPVLVHMGMHVAVHRRRQPGVGEVEDVVMRATNIMVCIGSSWGARSKLPLRQQPAGGAGGGGGGGGGGAGGRRGGATGRPLDAWSEYLHEGRITGTLTLLTPQPLLQRAAS